MSTKTNSTKIQQFRAVAEHVYHTQALHGVVREECVEYLQEHHKDFAAFICVNGRPYDDYVNKMRKPTTWGGEVELQALSNRYRFPIPRPPFSLFLTITLLLLVSLSLFVCVCGVMCVLCVCCVRPFGGRQHKLISSVCALVAAAVWWLLVVGFVWLAAPILRSTSWASR
jgi:hypothetical protein